MRKLKKYKKKMKNAIIIFLCRQLTIAWESQGCDCKLANEIL